MWFYIFHSFIYFYIFNIHAEIYILIQTESREVFQNPFLERRFALRYTFIWDFLRGILSFEIFFMVYFHLRFAPRYTFMLNLVHHTTKAAFICKDASREKKKRKCKNVEAEFFIPGPKMSLRLFPIFSLLPEGALTVSS